MFPSDASARRPRFPLKPSSQLYIQCGKVSWRSYLSPPKKKNHFLDKPPLKIPPLPRAHEKITESPDPTSPRLCRTKKNKCGCEKPPFTLLYSGDIGCICAIGIFDEHWMYWMDLANSEVHSSVVSYWAWWSWEVSSYPFQKTQKKTLLFWTILHNLHNLHIFSFKISPFAAALPNLCQVAPVRISSSPGAKTRRRSSTLRWRSQNSCGGVSWWIMMNHGYQ